ncbi:MAG: sulfotransferase family protein, partial [Nanoarchaeota archaeon]
MKEETDKEKKVNFFVVGEPKCGTTVLSRYFREHPEVEVSAKKEPHFFCTDILRESDKLHKDAVFFPIRAYENYNKLWSWNHEKLRGEFSPDYLFSKEAAENIYNYNPDAKIVAIFRGPVSFLKSWHKQCLKNGSEKPITLKESLKREDSRKKAPPKCPNYPQKLYYSDWVKYAEQLQRYLNVFPKEQIKVIFFEDLKQDNQKVMNELCDFFGVKRIKITKKEVNVRKDAISPKLFHYIINPPLIKGPAQRKLPSRVKSKICRVAKKILLKESKREPVS